jgi:hypothetical protein
MRRWTKKARIVLPGHLGSYGSENPALCAQTYRHTSLMISVLEYVELGDKNVDSYKIALQFLEEGKKAMKEANTASDGLGLADRGLQADSPPAVDVDDPFPLRVPLTRRDRGRPTNKSERAPHQVGSKRPRFCSVCHSSEHTKPKCPDRDKAEVRPRKAPTCSRCGLGGHISTGCGGKAQQLAGRADMLV